MTLARTMSPVSPYILRYLIADWEPPKTPHCTNCTYARISGPADNPLVDCARDHGTTLTLVQMLRERRPRQFVAAVNCPDFDSMGPPDGRMP